MKMIEAFRKEEWLPYMIVTLVLIQAILVLVSLFTGWITGGLGTFFVIGSYSQPYSFELMTSIILNVVVLCVSILGLVYAYKHDKALRKQQKDERELLHDQMVSSRSYKIALSVLTAYALFLGDPIILIILIAILFIRLRHRIQLEKTA